MTKIFRIHDVIIIAVVMVLVTAWSGGEAVAETASAGRFVVIGVDRTAGYDQMTAVGIAIAVDYVKHAGLGDEVVVRWISDRSYQADQLVGHLKVPTANFPVVRGIFNTRMKRRRELELAGLKAQVLTIKTETVELLTAQCVGPTKRTDIIGFVTAASEAFARIPQAVEHILVLATDLLENTHFNGDIDLTGAKVRVHLIHNVANPGEIAVMRKKWSEKFMRWGASEVEYLWPTLEQLNWSNKQCTQ